MGNVNNEVVAFYKQLGFTLIEIKSSVFRVEESTLVFQTDHKDHTVDASTILYKDAEKIFTQALQAQRDAGAEEERKRIEEQFPDYAHTRYLGCYAEGGIWHYSYDTEVIHLFADFLTPPIK